MLSYIPMPIQSWHSMHPEFGSRRHTGIKDQSGPQVAMRLVLSYLIADYPTKKQFTFCGVDSMSDKVHIKNSFSHYSQMPANKDETGDPSI